MSANILLNPYHLQLMSKKKLFFVLFVDTKNVEIFGGNLSLHLPNTPSTTYGSVLVDRRHEPVTLYASASPVAA